MRSRRSRRLQTDIQHTILLTDDSFFLSHIRIKVAVSYKQAKFHPYLRALAGRIFASAVASTPSHNQMYGHAGPASQTDSNAAGR